MEKTIVAIATPQGSGGVSIVRMSGKKSLEILKKVFTCKNKGEFTPRMMYLGTFSSFDFKEQCLAVYFKAPFSFTGEDIVEFQCHGGRLIAQGILETLLSHGATLAEAGEFSKRAFLNGKLSLDQAEGIMDMISAQSQSEIRAGYQLLKGKLQQGILDIQNQLTNLLARMEVSMDYPEEDIEEESVSFIDETLSNLLTQMDNILSTKRTGKIVRDGVKVAIVGKPNAGKSSLLNALLEYDRAIVTDIQGTTRDTIEESYLYQGLRFCLVDTAGIRESSDVVESIGIQKSWDALSYADILLVVLDSSQSLTIEDTTLLESLKNKNYFIVLNKNDLVSKIEEDKIQSILSLSCEDYEKRKILISAKNGQVDTIKKKLYEFAMVEEVENKVVLTNTRHIACLEEAQKSMQKALSALRFGQTFDLVAIDLKSAWLHLGDVTGNSQNESIITEIFEKFCVGK